MKKLIQSLHAAGCETIVLQDRVLLLPFGGRILGLYPEGTRNAFWVNPALKSPESAKAFLSASGWLNLGGDRTWISPEFETNIPDPSRSAESYDVPKPVDPANYSVVAQDNDSVKLFTPINVFFHRSRCTVSLDLSKQIQCVQPPFSEQASSAVGYELKTHLSLSSPPPEIVHPAVWNLIQVPPGGRISLPAQSPMRTKAFIGNPKFQIRNGWIECDVTTPKSFKFGVFKDDSQGIMFYFREENGWASLVVRKFDIRHNAIYSDVPSDDPTALGYIQQVYVDDGGLGGFGELEYHSPAIDDKGEVTDCSQTWAYSGSAKNLQDIARSLVADFSRKHINH